MLPNSQNKKPLNLHDCIEQEKYVIVLRVDPKYQFASDWYFLSKDPQPKETTQQDQILICDDIDHANYLIDRLKTMLIGCNAFIHPVTVQTRVSIWGNWSIPTNSVSEVK
jgi:hypothetical protein